MQESSGESEKRRIRKKKVILAWDSFKADKDVEEDIKMEMLFDFMFSERGMDVQDD